MKLNLREWILNRAKNIVVEDRLTVHGEPENSFETIKDLWNGYLSDILKRPLETHEVAILMILLKVARVKNNAQHTDNWTDMIGYSACGFEAAVESTMELVVDGEVVKSEDDEIPF